MTHTKADEFRGYPLRTRTIDVGGRSFRLLGPANYETLVDRPKVAARFERDEYMPYWAEFWPAGLLLAEAVGAWGPWRETKDAPSVLELGCGLGLVGMVAASLGFRVIVSDYDEDALAFAKENARRNDLPVPETRHIDWREAYGDLRVDRILAADALYETRNLRPIAEFIHHHLAADGFALLSDCNRVTADAFESIARHCGLSVAIRPASTDGEAVVGRIFELHRKKP